MVALGALGCGSDNKAADNKAGSKVTGSVTGSGSSALLPLAKDAASKFKAINPDVLSHLTAATAAPVLSRLQTAALTSVTLTYRQKAS